jgi:hypothetical protein
MNTTAFQGWIANLSDGTTAQEAPPRPGLPSAWQVLLSVLRDSNPRLSIVRLRLFRAGLQFVTLPEKQADGYFQAYESSKALFSGENNLRQGIGSVIGDKIYIVWISNEGSVYQDIRPLLENKIHTTLA